MLKICAVIGCGKTSDDRYCPKHRWVKKEKEKERFSFLNNSSEEARSVYNSTAWKKTSLYHRRIEPLCQQCRREERITAGSLVHHKIPLQELIDRGLSPFDEEFLETLCMPCHQRELQAKARIRIRA